MYGKVSLVQGKLLNLLSLAQVSKEIAMVNKQNAQDLEGDAKLKGTKEPKSLNFAGQHLTTLKMEVLETITVTAQAVTFLV